ncbi:MAG TPA: antibiotic biosynthesis monooxygenase [Candidatus Baltobacteraceae bacterium]
MFYRYRVHPAQARAFEHAYGRTGPWAALFAKHPAFRRTRLFRHRDDPSLYVTVDVWEDRAGYDDFRVAHTLDYGRLDRQLALLKIEEHLLGFYEGTGEYREPPDNTKA